MESPQNHEVKESQIVKENEANIIPNNRTEFDLFQYHLSITEMASYNSSFNTKSSLDNNNNKGLFIDEARQELFTYELIENKYNVKRIPFSGDSKNNQIQTYAISNGLVDDIKMSKDCSHISIRRGGSIEMLSLIGGYSINYRVPSDGLLLSYFWPLPTILLVICTTGFELLKVSVENMKTKLIKRISMPINWFVYSAVSRILLVSTSHRPSIFQAFNVLRDNLIEPLIIMPLFDIFPKGFKGNSRPRDILISKIYNAIYCIHTDIDDGKIRFWRLSIHDVIMKLEINIHTKGNVDISVVDNLLIVHCITEKVSLIYDILAEGPLFSCIEFPIAAPLPITPYFFTGPEKIPVHLTHLYENWKFIFPDFIFSKYDCKIWKISIHLDDITRDITSPIQLINFLLRRKKSKELILETLRKFMKTKEDTATLGIIFSTITSNLRECFNQDSEKENGSLQYQSLLAKRKAHEYYNLFLLNHNCTPLKDKEPLPDLGIPKVSEFVFNGQQVVSQDDFYFYVLLEFAAQFDCTKKPYSKYFVAVIIEYINCLLEAKIQVNTGIYELLITILLATDRFYQCYQLIQYRIIGDSLHIAFLLLSLEKKHPDCYQVAIDMLKRLNFPKQIIKVLLAKNKVSEALAYTKRYHYQTSFNPENYLDISIKNNDTMEFFNVFSYFQNSQNPVVSQKVYLDYYNNFFHTQPKPF